MSQRMRPIANLATDCILLCDDRSAWPRGRTLSVTTSHHFHTTNRSPFFPSGTVRLSLEAQIFTAFHSHSGHCCFAVPLVRAV